MTDRTINDDALLDFIKLFRELVSLIGPERAADLAHRVFRPRNVAYALALFCEMGQLRAEQLREKGITKTGAYRALNALRELGLIEPDESVQLSRRGGPKAQVWRLRR